MIDHLLPSCTDAAAPTHPDSRPQTGCAGRTEGSALQPEVVTMPGARRLGELVVGHRGDQEQMVGKKID